MGTIWNLMMKMNMPTEDAQDCMRELGERSMGNWFENMDKMDIQAERQNTAEARKELAEAKEKLAEAEGRLFEAENRLSDARSELSDTQSTLSDTKNKLLDAAITIINMNLFTYSLIDLFTLKEVLSYWGLLFHLSLS